MIPAPPWFVVVDLVSYVPCGLLGARLAGGAAREHREWHGIPRDSAGRFAR